MTTILIEVLRYILTLLFGVFVSASFLNIPFRQKSFWTLLLFSAATLSLQGLLCVNQDITRVTAFYPLVTHLPLFLLFFCVFHKRPLPSLLAVLTAYLCCQISNWTSYVPNAFHAPSEIVDLTYSLTLIPTFLLIQRFLSRPISRLLEKHGQTLVSFSIIPIFYYIFDYLFTVYTDLLYNGNPLIVEFVPFLLCICYLIFCAVYFRQYEEAQEMENRNKMLYIKQEQSRREIEAIRRSESSIALLRHDMRHFLNTISEYIDVGELQKAQDYIHTIVQAADRTALKKHCSNQTINLILSYYESLFDEEDISFSTRLAIPQQLAVSDTDLTSILSNGLENACNAVRKLPPDKRIIELNMWEQAGKLYLSLENTFAEAPVFSDGMPVAQEANHGFGTQSIYYTTEKLSGHCRFSVSNDRFMLQVIL